MDNSGEAVCDKAAYLAQIDDIIFNSLAAVENKTKSKTHSYDEFRSTNNTASVNVLNWIKETKDHQHQILKQTSYMASQDSSKQEGTPLEEQQSDLKEPVHNEEAECEEGEIEDSEEEDEEDEEYYDSEEGQYKEEESNGEEEYCEEDYDHWHEQEEYSNNHQHKEKRRRSDSTSTLDDKPSLALLDDSICMNLQSMKKSAIDKQDKQQKLKRQMQDLCSRIVREFGNSVKLTLLKEQLHTNMEKLTKVLTAYDRVFNVFTLNGCAHVRALPQLDLCDEFCSRSGCSKEECSGLHLCKFYLLGLKCQFGRKQNSCRYGHTIRCEHNAPLLAHCFLDKLETDELVSVLRQRRSLTTVPKVCKHYNFETGCRHNKEGEGCVALHVCKYYVKGECRFAENCIRSHNLEDEQPSALLHKCGLDPADSETNKRLTECYEQGFFIMPYVPFVSEKPKSKPKPPRRPTGRKVRKKMKRKTKTLKGLKIRITQDVTKNSKHETIQDENFPAVPQPRFMPPPPFRPPFDPFFRPLGPDGGLMRPPGGPFIYPGPHGGPRGPPRLLGPPIGPPIGPLIGPPIGPPLGPPFVPLLAPPPPGLLPTPAPGPRAPEPVDFLSPPPDIPSEFERPPSVVDTGMYSDTGPEHPRIPSPRDDPVFDSLDDPGTNPRQTIRPDFNTPPEHKFNSRQRYEHEFDSPERRTPEFRPRREEPAVHGRHHEEIDYGGEIPGRLQKEFRGDRNRRERDRSPHREPAWSSPRRLHERPDERRRPSPRRRRDSDRDWRRSRKRSLSRGESDRDDDRHKLRRMQERDDADKFHASSRHNHDVDHRTQHSRPSPRSRALEDPSELYGHEESMPDDMGPSRIWNDIDDDVGGERAAIHDIDERDTYRGDPRYESGRCLGPDSVERYCPLEDFRQNTFQDDDCQHRHSRNNETQRERNPYHHDANHNFIASRTSRPDLQDRFERRSRHGASEARHHSPRNIMEDRPRRSRSPPRYNADYPPSPRRRNRPDDILRDASRRRR